MEAAEAQELSLRMLAVGALLIWAISFAFSDGPRRVRAAAVVFCASAIGYAFNEHALTRSLVGALSAPLWLLSVAAVGWFWLFVRGLFEDEELEVRALAVPGGLTATGLLGWFSPPSVQPGLWLLHHLLELGVGGHAAFLVVQSWRADLIESRRRLRAGVVVAMTLFVGLLATVQVRTILEPQEAQPRLLIAALFAILATAGAATFLRSRVGILGAERRLRAGPEGSSVEDVIIARLRLQMAEGEVWRQEGLTIGALAQAVGAPEHRLRSIINGRLGYRNFTRYINDHRVGAAREILSDPAHAGKTIATVAFDLGYGSLGPFNRAFRELAGMTPTEWRQRAFTAPPADS